jgi:RNA processing factor Prp31
VEIKGRSSDISTASTINKALSIPVLSDSTTQDLYRGIRQQLSALLGGVDQRDINTMSLGLGHSLSRFKLKFSTDKVDTMVIQAIALLDDLDKEINIYSMRVKVRRAARLWTTTETELMVVVGMVWMALPRDGQDHRRQPRLRPSRQSHG